MIDKEPGIYGTVVTKDDVTDLSVLNTNFLTIKEANNNFHEFNFADEVICYLQKRISDQLNQISSDNKKITYINMILKLLKEDLLSNKILLSVDKKDKNFFLKQSQIHGFGKSSIFTLNDPFHIMQLLKRNSFSCSQILMVIPNLSISLIRPLFGYFDRLQQLKIKVRILTSKPSNDATIDEYGPLLKLAEYDNVSIKAQKSFYLLNPIVHRYILFIRKNNNSSVIIDFPQTFINSSLPSDSQIGFNFLKKDSLVIYNKIYDDFILRWFSSDYHLLSQKLVDYIRVSRRSFEKTIENSTWSDFALTNNFNYHLYPFQKDLLKEIESRRTFKKRNSFFILMGDNCGKTIITAFDYKKICDTKKIQQPNLLFVTNRVLKAQKACNQYRVVLQDKTFGTMFSRANDKLKGHKNIFATRQYLAKNLLRFDTSAFDYVVVEGITKANYEKNLEILNYFDARNLLVINKNHELTSINSLMKLFGFTYLNRIDIMKPIYQGLSKKIEYYALGDTSSDLVGLHLKKAKPIEISYRLESKERFAFFKKILDKYLLLSSRTKCLVIAYDDNHALKLAEFIDKMYNAEGIALSFTSERREDEFDEFAKQLDYGVLKFVVATHSSLEHINSDLFNVLINHSFDDNKYTLSRKLFACLMRDDNFTPLLVLDFVLPMDKDYDYIRNKYNLFFNYYEAKTIIKGGTYSKLGIFFSFDSTAQTNIFKREAKIDAVNSIEKILPKNCLNSTKTYANFFLDHRIYLWDVYSKDKYLFEILKCEQPKPLPPYLSPLNIIPNFFLCNSFSFLTACYDILKKNNYVSYSDNILLMTLASFFNNSHGSELLNELKKHCSKPTDALYYLKINYPSLINEICNLIDFRLNFGDNIIKIKSKILNKIEFEPGAIFTVKQILSLFSATSYKYLNARIIEELHPRSLDTTDEPWIVWGNHAVNKFNGLCTKLINLKTLSWSSPYNWSKNSASFKEFCNLKRPVIITYRNCKINPITNTPQPYQLLGEKTKIYNIIGNKPLNMVIKIR